MIPYKRLLVVFWLPGLMFLTYFLVRINNYQPATELQGLSGAIRALFLAFAVSVAYLMYLLPQWAPFSRSPVLKTHFWLYSALVLLLVLADDVFMIHEELGEALDTPDKYFLIAYGGLLGAVVLFYRRRLTKTYWGFLLAFGALSVIAILADNTKSTLTIAGRTGIDYEQICETIGLFALASAYGAQGVHELREAAS